jgi:hypothetical protein
MRLFNNLNWEFTRNFGALTGNKLALRRACPPRQERFIRYKILAKDHNQVKRLMAR